MRTASKTVKLGKGVCRDHSFAVAVPALAVNIPAKVVYVDVRDTGGWGAQFHAWNGLYADGRWVIADTTKFFDPEPGGFAKTHRAEATMV